MLGMIVLLFLVIYWCVLAGFLVSFYLCLKSSLKKLWFYCVGVCV